MCVWCACVYKYMWVIGVNISILWCVCSMWYACVCRVCVYMRYECGCVCMWLCVGGMYVATCVWVVYITVCMWGGYVAVCVCGAGMWLCVYVGCVCGCVCVWVMYVAVCVCGVCIWLCVCVADFDLCWNSSSGDGSLLFSYETDCFPPNPLDVARPLSQDHYLHCDKHCKADRFPKWTLSWALIYY